MLKLKQLKLVLRVLKLPSTCTSYTVIHTFFSFSCKVLLKMSARDFELRSELIDLKMLMKDGQGTEWGVWS